MWYIGSASIFVGKLNYELYVS